MCARKYTPYDFMNDEQRKQYDKALATGLRNVCPYDYLSDEQYKKYRKAWHSYYLELAKEIAECPRLKNKIFTAREASWILTGTGYKDHVWHFQTVSRAMLESEYRESGLFEKIPGELGEEYHYRVL